MAPLVIRRPNRPELSLATSPPKVADGDHSDDNSPHVNTWQTSLRGTEKSADPQPTTGVPEAHELNAEEGCNEGQNSGAEVAVSGTMAHQEDTEAMTSNSGDEQPSYIPAHLRCESESPHPIGLDQDGEIGDVNSSGLLAQEYKDPREAKAEGGWTPPPPSLATGCIHKRIPSSSIPHLLSESNSISSDAAQFLHQQLSFVGIEAALSPTVRSREDSFALSVDGDDSASKKQPPPSPQVVQQAHLVMNLRAGTSPMIDGRLSNLSSPLSIASIASLTSQNFQLGNAATPPHPPYNSASPPQKVPMSTHFQGLQSGLIMPQLGQPPSAMQPNDAPPMLTHQANLDGQQIQTKIRPGPVPEGGLPMPIQQLPPVYQNSRCSLQPSVQPILYSAINSLEKYNAGSFENKMMLAKARGAYGRQKAFPGIPTKKTDQTSVASSADSGVESKDTSAMSEIRKSPRGSTASEADGMPQPMGISQNAMIVKESGVEQIVPITSEPSEKRLYKSKSSGNIEGGAESLEELKPARKNSKSNRSVTIQDEKPPASRRGKRREKQVGVFRPSSDAYTPRMGNRAIKYKPAEERAPVEKISSTMGTIQRPNFRDALRRVAIILHQHIVKIERRFSTGIRGVDDTGLFKASMREAFNEDNFATPRYKCAMVRVPMARPGVVYSMRKIRVVHTTPTTDEIYEFAHQLFKKVQLSSECSIVCLIYVEKLMEVAKVPLVAETWRPIFMCGLLLASKVWQDLSSWNIEFACVYPQFSLDAINRLELSFLKFIKWDLYISSR